MAKPSRFPNARMGLVVAGEFSTSVIHAHPSQEESSEAPAVNFRACLPETDSLSPSTDKQLNSVVDAEIRSETSITLRH